MNVYTHLTVQNRLKFDLSFFLTINTGLAQGDLDGIKKPFSTNLLISSSTIASEAGDLRMALWRMGLGSSR